MVENIVCHVINEAQQSKFERVLYILLYSPSAAFSLLFQTVNCMFACGGFDNDADI